MLEAAMIEFGDHGFRGASIANIAARSGVSRMTVYKHFANKEQILEQLSIHTSGKLRSLLANVLQMERPVWSILLEVGRCFYAERQIVDSRSISRVLVMEAKRMPELVKRGLEWRRYALEPLTEYFQRQAFEGVLNIENPERAAHQFLHLSTSSVDYLFADMDWSADKYEEWLAAAVKTFLYGVNIRTMRTTTLASELPS